ncbi:MAG TPA: Coenzyme F420 hydrogenase/dehydrogenase, beta subunit C-terminal domain [Caproiciproducens sp.]|nr:Coenzyme F420 hydrogenase/dehydrogenase, beta subunit C-terminal domain [Caproiciproducens sp.]
MIQLFSNPENCCGCTACLNICPKNAISMLPDEKGFLYPKIDIKLCVQCGLCRKVCPFHEKSHMDENLKEPDVYAVKHRSGDVRMRSSSGGMFTAISDYLLDEGATVYGAAFAENFEVCHQRAETREERDKFRGSKYVQSNLKNVFQQVKTDLETSRYVLFSGNPCQTAGLYNFLKNSGTNMKKLYLCDLVCHGTPSPQIFKEYLDFLKKKYRSEISSMTFRYKPLGWKVQAVSIWFHNKKQYSSQATQDIFYRLFSSNIILRDSCCQCPFTNLHRPSDITIGDFWGVEKSLPDFEDEKGVSLVLVNTEKGQQLFHAVESGLTYCVSSTESGMQLNLRQASFASPKTQPFWKDYQKRGFLYITKKYAGIGLKSKIKNCIKKVLQTVGLFDVAKKMLKKAGKTA